MFRDLHALSPFAGLILLALLAYAAAALLLGWIFGFDPLVRYAMTQAAMVPATTLGFMATGLAVATAATGERKASNLLSALVLVLVALAGTGELFGWKEPTELFFAQLEPPERIAPVTALGFLLALYAINRMMIGALFVVEAISVFGLSGAIVITLLNLGGMIEMLDLRLLIGVSLQTSILFALLFTALCLLAVENRPD